MTESYAIDLLKSRRSTLEHDILRYERHGREARETAARMDVHAAEAREQIENIDALLGQVGA